MKSEFHKKSAAITPDNTNTPSLEQEGNIMLPVNMEPTPLATGDVFISYRHCNADLVASVEAELQRRGISYFIDRVGVNYGKYSKAITKAISDCKLLLLFWTSDVKGSDDIVNEVVLALKLKKTVIPYKIGEFNELEHPEMCYHLASLNRYEVPCQTPETVVKVVDRIERVLSGKPAPDKTIIASKKKSVFSWKTLIAALLVVAFVVCGILYNNVVIKKKADDLYNQATAFRSAKNYDFAIIKIEEALKIFPDNMKFQAEKQKIVEERAIGKNPDNNPNRLFHEGTKAGERRVIPISGADFAFRWCPSGTFTMGSPESEDKRWGSEKQHQVTLTKGFWMMEKEVTQKQWMAVMGKNPSNNKEGENFPVEQVSWNDCQDFCIKCCSLFGMSVRLPTEAQWEYACRAGSSTAFSWGNELNGDKANCAGNWPYGTKTEGKYLKKTTPVGSYPPNAWGLYDMHGNVQEWCADWYGAYPSENATDPTGPSNGSSRVYRGGSWNDYAKCCRSAYRDKLKVDKNNNALGFRFVITPQ